MSWRTYRGDTASSFAASVEVMEFPLRETEPVPILTGRGWIMRYLVLSVLAGILLIAGTGCGGMQVGGMVTYTRGGASVSVTFQ